VHIAAGLLNPCSSEAVRLGLKKMGRESSARQTQAHPLGWKDIKEFIESAGVGLRADRVDFPVHLLAAGTLGEQDDYGAVLIKTQPGKTKQAVASLEKLCKQLNPKFPFTYQFSDEEYAKLYTSEQMVGNLADSFAFLAIFISCLGLLGLAMFTAEQRNKEIGIRKVLGASVASVFSLLSKEFLILVIVALVIATPIAWISMSKWLEEYHYRTDISWWMFAIAGLAAIAITLFTVSFQAIKAAVANPVKSLRTE